MIRLLEILVVTYLVLCVLLVALLAAPAVLLLHMVDRVLLDPRAWEHRAAPWYAP